MLRRLTAHSYTENALLFNSAQTTPPDRAPLPAHVSLLQSATEQSRQRHTSWSECLGSGSVPVIFLLKIRGRYPVSLSHPSVFVPSLPSDAGVDSLSWRHITSGGETRNVCSVKVLNDRGGEESMLMENKAF